MAYLLVGALLLVPYFGLYFNTSVKTDPDSGSSVVFENPILIPSVPSTPLFVRHDVPFTPQAPFSNWWDPAYKEWCEEASMLMAVAWARGETLSPAEAGKKIREISDFEQKFLWTFVHASLSDTARVMENYFWFRQFGLFEDVKKEALINELKKGNIVIVPVAGRELKNSHFSPPGPLNHMLVVIGYDEVKREFIANDPGTKNGNSYRYSEDLLYEAIWNYPTSSADMEWPIRKNEKPIISVYRKPL